MKNKPQCPMCEGELNFIGNQLISIGKKTRKSFFSTNDKTINAEVFQCSDCGNLQFYNPLITKNKPDKKPLPKEMLCLRCGKNFETAYGHCPYCGWENDDN